MVRREAVLRSTQGLVDELDSEIRQLRLMLRRNDAAIVKLQRQMDNLEGSLEPRQRIKAKKR